MAAEVAGVDEGDDDGLSVLRYSQSGVKESRAELGRHLASMGSCFFLPGQYYYYSFSSSVPTIRSVISRHMSS